MQYLGGKSRLAKKIVDLLPINDACLIWEPFCGGASITAEIARRIRSEVPLCATDTNQDLIALYQAAVQGWEPPEIRRNITDQEYQQAKNSSSSPLRTFIGFGCSFGGKWWGGLARSGEQVYYEEGRRLFQSKMRPIQAHGNVQFSVLDYNHSGLIPPIGSLVYCDPPYLGTTGYQGTFDHLLFWARCRDIARAGSRVFVSEFRAPAGVRQVACWPRKTTVVSANHEVKNESLFEVEP